ncbi:MAG TPA: glycosyltransferase family 4 protein [Thermoleophilaceae bacterium]
MRVALVHHSYGTPYGGAAEPHVRELARALRAAGHEPRVIGSRPGPTRRSDEDGIEVVHLGRLPEGPLRSRGFDGPVTHLPALVRELARGGYDAVHAFSPQDAAAAARAAAGRATPPLVFTPVEPPRREALAERRLRLRFWEAAIAPPTTLVVPGDDPRAAVWRWLAVEASVVAPDDADGHVKIYCGG